MTLTFVFALNPEKAVLSEAFEELKVRQVLKQQFRIVLDAGSHHHQSILSLHNDDGSQWTQEHIGNWHKIRRDGRVITSAEAIKLSRVTNLTSALVRYNAFISNLLEGMVRYAHAFQTESCSSFFDP